MKTQRIMNSIELSKSLLHKQFHEFYNEIIQQKKRILERNNNSNSTIEGNVEEHSEAQIHDNVTHPVFISLLNVLNKQVIQTRAHSGEYGIKYYKEAQFAMAGLADEIFLNLNWEGKDAWKSSLLEFKLFGTNAAGELFFRKLDHLLKNRDLSDIELAAIFFLCLSLGFKGKYRDTDQESQLDYYRNQLFIFIFQENPELLTDSKCLFPDSYSSTLVEGAGKKLPYLRWWISGIILLLIVFVFTSHFAWNHLTADIVELIEQISIEA
jgi:type VI secretion system protein ImpK